MFVDSLMFIMLEKRLVLESEEFHFSHVKCQGTSRNLGECYSYSGGSTILTLVYLISRKEISDAPEGQCYAQEQQNAQG